MTIAISTSVGLDVCYLCACIRVFQRRSVAWMVVSHFGQSSRPTSFNPRHTFRALMTALPLFALVVVISCSPMLLRRINPFPDLTIVQ